MYLLEEKIRRFGKRFGLIRKLHELALRISNNLRSKKTLHGKNNKILLGKCSLKKVRFDVAGSDNTIEIGSQCFIRELTFYIRGNSNHVRISDNCMFNGASSIWQEDDFTDVVIGRNTTFEGVHIAATEDHSKISIGENCMFSYDIELRTGDSHSIVDKDNQKRINHAKDVVIGNNVWIGAHSVVLKGVSIEDQVVIGIGSIVTKPIIERHVVVAGNPAEIIKRNIEWKRERIS